MGAWNELATVCLLHDTEVARVVGVSDRYFLGSCGRKEHIPATEGLSKGSRLRPGDLLYGNSVQAYGSLALLRADAAGSPMTATRTVREM